MEGLDFSQLPRPPLRTSHTGSVRSPTLLLLMRRRERGRLAADLLGGEAWYGAVPFCSLRIRRRNDSLGLLSGPAGCAGIIVLDNEVFSPSAS